MEKFEDSDLVIPALPQAFLSLNQNMSREEKPPYWRWGFSLCIRWASGLACGSGRLAWLLPSGCSPALRESRPLGLPSNWCNMALIPSRPWRL